MKNTISEAIANMSSISEQLQKFCNEPENYNSYGSQMVEQMSWELYRKANELKEFQHRYGF